MYLKSLDELIMEIFIKGCYILKMSALVCKKSLSHKVLETGLSLWEEIPRHVWPVFFSQILAVVKYWKSKYCI